MSGHGGVGRGVNATGGVYSAVQLRYRCPLAFHVDKGSCTSRRYMRKSRRKGRRWRIMPAVIDIHWATLPLGPALVLGFHRRTRNGTGKLKVDERARNTA